MPGADSPEGLVDVPGAEPVNIEGRLGRKGLRYKDRATRLAYCAARDALAWAAVDGDESTAVVVSSNVANLDTVCRVSHTIATESTAATSPMDLPNASVNVVASSLAIRFGLAGPNIMLGNGRTSGLDAVRWAVRLIATGRAERVLVTGVEPVTPEIAGLLGSADRLDGAVAVVVEAASTAAGRGVPPLAEIGAATHAADLTDCVDRLAATEPAFGLWHLPGHVKPIDDQLAGVPRADLTDVFGDASGALGVLQCAAAVGFLRTGGSAPVLLTNGGADVTGLVLRPVGVRMTDLALPHHDELTLRINGDTNVAVPVVLRRHTRGDLGRLLVLHGLATSSTLWRDFVARAPEGYEIWSADLPWRGMGVPGWPRTDLLATLAETITGVPGGVDCVVAHSFTTLLLLDLLCRARTPPVRAVVLTTPMYRARADEFTWDTAKEHLEGFHRILEEGIRVHARRPLDDDRVRRLGMRMRDAIGPYGWSRFFQTYMDTPWLRLRQVTVPCLVLTGDEDFAAPPAEGRALADRLPRARLREFTGSGHFLMTERPDDFTAEVTRFLADALRPDPTGGT
ncbi:hypothetical protein GCM10029964_083600 [Kibdelosporangium lantanae]